MLCDYCKRILGIRKKQGKDCYSDLCSHCQQRIEAKMLGRLLIKLGQ